MNGKAWGWVCVGTGLATSFSGYQLIRSQEHPSGTTGFEGPRINRRGVVILMGNLLLAFGLAVAVIISSFFFIGG
ncbi:MAG: hypothetical protein KGJ84_06820 [Elusimicrobia bacterium]|nr:hypothetical protein [Elusimicrobiota bacterium]